MSQLMSKSTSSDRYIKGSVDFAAYNKLNVCVIYAMFLLPLQFDIRGAMKNSPEDIQAAEYLSLIF